MPPKNELSKYELQRLETIEANKKKLVALGIESAVEELRTIARPARAPIKGAAINKRAKSDGPPPRQRSLRLQNLDADGNTLPDKEAQPSPTPEPALKRQRKTSAPLDAAKNSTGATSPEEAATFLDRLGSFTVEAPAKAQKGKAKGKAKAAEAAAPETLDLDKLSVAEDDIAKLVPERIFSMEVHPSATKLLVAAGDTWGRVGLWDVGAGDDAPVATFEPHSRPVAGLRVLAHQPHQLLSCSHDGAVRCFDLGAGAASSFVELYRAPEDSDGDYPTLHGLSRTVGEGGVLAACRVDGAVALLDPRVGGAEAQLLRLHEKKVFCADFSAARPWQLASASLDRTVALWDVRAIGGSGKPKRLATLEHGLSVTAARFAPGGTRLLTTCNDNLLRVYESAGGAWSSAPEPLRAVKHNNHTGRYITPFQAEWLRGSDDVFLCGSLEHPRGIDVLRCDGAPAPRLEDENVTSVVSLVAAHPTLPLLVGSNSGGKCFVWR